MLYQCTACRSREVVLTWLHRCSGLAVRVGIEIVFLGNVDWWAERARVEEGEHLLPRPLSVPRPEPRPLLQHEINFRRGNETKIQVLPLVPEWCHSEYP